MTVTKSIGFNMNDADAVALEIAEEIKKDWHITYIEHHSFSMCKSERLTEPVATIHFVRRDSK